MVDLVRFERTPSTFAESRSHSTELQVQSLAETAGVEPAHAIAPRLSGPLPYQLGDASECLAEGTGLEPASDIRAVVFGTTALPVRLPFPVESYISDFKSGCNKISNPRSTCAKK